MSTVISSRLQCTVNSHDYNDGTTYNIEAYSLPEAAKLPEALRIEAGSGKEMPNGLADAKWSFTWTVFGATSAAINASIRALLADFQPWTEVSTFLPGESFPHVMYLTGVNPPMKTPMVGGAAKITLSGTRWGYWLAATSTYALDGSSNPIHNYACNLPGVVNVVGSAGTSYGLVSATVTVDQSPTQTIALACKPNPPTSYQPWQKYTGTTVGGAYSAGSGPVALVVPTSTGSWQVGTETPTALDSVAYADNVLVLARVANNYTTAAGFPSYRAQIATRIASNTLPAVYATGQPVAATQNGGSGGSSWIFEVANLGVMPVPADPLPQAGGSFNSQVFAEVLGTTSYQMMLDTLAWLPASFCEVVTGPFSTNGFGCTIENISPQSQLRRAYLSTHVSTNPAPGPALSRTPYGYGLWMPPGNSAWVPFCDARDSMPTSSATPASTGHMTLIYRACYSERLGAS